MATSISLVNNGVNTLTDTPQIFFTASSGGNGVLIDSVTATNNSIISASYKAYIAPVSPTPTTPLKPFKVVVWGRLDTGVGVVNQFIPAGQALWFEASALASIYFTVSGREI